MRAKLLKHVLVAEVGQSPYARFCGRMLVDLGARVVRVSPGGADGSRGAVPAQPQLPPWLEFYLNVDKTAAASVDDAVGGADIIIVDTGENDPRCDRIVADVRSGTSSAVIAAVGPFGSTGPRASFQGAPLNVFHAGGEGFLLPGGQQYVDRAPTQPTGFVAAYDTGVTMATVAVAALIRRRRTGRGAVVDVSAQEAVMSLNRTVWTKYTTASIVEHRYDRGYPIGGIMPCKDGWVTVAAGEDHQWKALAQVLDAAELVEDPRFASRELRQENGAEARPILIDRLSQRHRDDLTQAAQAAHVPIAGFQDVDEALATDQFAARGFFDEIENSGKQLRVPRFPAAFRDAPSQGSKQMPAVDSDLPLAGVRVADFTWVLAGPYASMLLAFLGAEVIKIESRTRPDGARRLYPVPGAQPGDLEVAAGHIAINMNKHSVTLNLSEDRGRDLAQQIVLRSDVVIDNYSPGVMGRMGMAHEKLLEKKPELVCISSSTYGSAGPKSHYVGYAPLFNALSGMGHMLGYPDSPPGELRTGADLRVGAINALATVAALESRYETGLGRSIDVSSTEVMSSAIGDQFVRAQWEGRKAMRDGNRMPYAAPHDCYRCAGEDRWLSIAVWSEEQWRALCEVAAHPEWRDDPRFANVAARLQHLDALDEAIGKWTADKDMWQLTKKLQAAGIAAYPSMSVVDLDHDEHLRARGIWVDIDHPRLGRVMVAAAPFMIDGRRPPIWTAGPLIGEHTSEVLTGMLGLSDQEVRVLKEANVVS